jgi:hypothetical protein
VVRTSQDPRELWQGGGSSSSGKGGKKATKLRGKEEAKKAPTDEEPIRCNNCGKKGHWAKDYWSKPRKKEKAHVAKTEEEEPSLFLVRSTTVQKKFPSPHLFQLRPAPISR